jgi:dienelactone hydrolase
MRQRKTWAGVLIALLIVLIVGIAGFVLWATNSYPPMPEALASLDSDELVRVELDPWITFEPLKYEPINGLILYPGGRVDPKSYAPSARAIAETGTLVVITPMPLNLAFLNSNAAAEVIAAHPDIKNWVIGGHSLGGSMAALFTSENPGQVDGLVLWASYPAESNDLSDQPILMTSIYGTLDGLATPEKVLAATPLLPAGTTWVPINGGNHAQFGWYGPQEGDNPATISREQQQVQILTATQELLSRLEDSQ